MKIHQFVNRFQQSKKLGTGWLVRCPAHDDQKASLSVGVGQTGGIVIYCHAGCSTQAIVDAMGLMMSDLAPETAPTGKPTITKTYDYCDVGGKLLYQVCRKSDKTFLQRRPDGSGGWIWKTGKAVKRVPYRLPSLVNRPTVYVVEGEKDADRLWEYDIPATTNAGGAGKWGASESKSLKEVGVSRVIILPDNDGPGVAHANEVAQRCRAKGLAVTIVQLPDLPEHGDVSDWLDAGNDIADLQDIVSSTPYVLPPPSAAGTGLVPDVQTVEPAQNFAPDGQPAPNSANPDELPNPTGYAPSFSDGTPYDVGAAEAFRDRFGDRVRYDHAQRRWLIWDGHFWRPDESDQIWRLAKQHADLWQMESMKAVTYPNRRNLVNFTLKLDKRGSMENMLKCAMSEEPIATSGSQWDTNHWLLGVKNGVVDLKTGVFRGGQREDWITKQVGCDYDPSATCSRWLQFLDEVMCGDVEMIDYLHRALGYSLTGDMREQCFFVAIGGGANGKSIFLDTLEYVWGDYGHRANMKIFIGNNDDAQKFHLAELDGRRLIFAAETKPGQRINEHVVKNFTGGESQSAERKFGQPFTFKPIGKIWLGVNHQPRVADDSYGFWRRVRLVEFLRTFVGSSDDRDLKDKLFAESAGILNWALDGCRLWQETGLTAPAKVTEAVFEYQQAEDPIRDFFNDCIEIVEDGITPFSSVWGSYNDWCEAMKIAPRYRTSMRSLGETLKRRFPSYLADGRRRYRGFIVRPAKVSQGTPGSTFGDFPTTQSLPEFSEPEQQNLNDSDDYDLDQ